MVDMYMVVRRVSRHVHHSWDNISKATSARFYPHARLMFDFSYYYSGYCFIFS
jgi:hypothetical protein